jgi:glycosyltransferase involved in cell wall biosynthesis
MTSLPKDAPRVAVLAPLKQWGGIERKIWTLCDEFLRLGVEPELWKIRGGETPYPDSLPDGLRVVDLDTRSKLDGVPAVMRQLRAARPAALLTAKDHAAQTGIIASALSGTHVPVFVKATNMPSASIRRPVQRYVARMLYRRASAVIANSAGVADAVADELHVPRSRISVIFNPTITRNFEHRVHGPVRHPWLLEGDPPVILAAGRFTPQKDFGMLLDAFARLRQWRAARLIVLGEGPGREELEDRARDLGVAEYCDLPGVVDDPVPMMRAASLFALSSRHEGLVNVLIEALGSGTRLVSTDCPSGPSEILDNGRFGRLVPVGDSEALARAMHESLSQPRPAAETVQKACDPFRAEPVARAYLRTMGVPHDGW